MGFIAEYNSEVRQLINKLHNINTHGNNFKTVHNGIEKIRDA